MNPTLRTFLEATLGILIALVVAAGVIAWAEQIEAWWSSWKKRRGT